jgi:hypothetical protein
MFVSTAKYIYTLESDFSYATGIPIPRPFMFGTSSRNWLSISEEGVISISVGYSWDGCSPKFRLLWSKYVFGASDGAIKPETGKPQCYYGSLVHDACYQFMDAAFPYNRKQVDGFFYDLIKRDGFKYATEYYKIVRAVGGVWHKL